MLKKIGRGSVVFNFFSKTQESTVKLVFYIFLSFSVILFTLPFLLGLIFAIFSSVGITPIWTSNQAEVFNFSILFKTLKTPLYMSQLIASFIRAQLIVASTLLFVFIFGYIISNNYRRKCTQWIMYFLSIPHVSVAIGFTVLIMPSGMIFRVLAFFMKHTDVTSMSIIHDTYGISMSFVVFMKLVAFLLFVLISTLQEYKLQYHILQAKLLRHNKFRTWVFVIFPQLLPKLFIPTLISVVYALAPIDIAVILGPRSPSSYGLIIQELLSHYSREQYITAHVLSIGLAIISFISILFWYGVFNLLFFLLRKGYVHVHKIVLSDRFSDRVSQFCFIFFTAIFIASTVLLVIWASVIRWDFPGLFPTVFGICHQFQFLYRISQSLMTTLFLACFSTLFSLIISLFILELLSKVAWRFQFPVLSFIMFPLLIPTLVYITGMHIFFLYSNINGTFFALVWGHALRVTPYMILVLYGTFRNYNNYYMLQASVLGKSYIVAFFTVKVPMLVTSINYAILIGMIVSIAEYVTTQFIGEGKWETATQLAVALHAGGNRQIMSLSGTLLMVLNMLILLCGNISTKLQKGMPRMSL